jgi:hypothetical protein
VRFSHQGVRYLFEIDLLELLDLVWLHGCQYHSFCWVILLNLPHDLFSFADRVDDNYLPRGVNGPAGQKVHIATGPYALKIDPTQIIKVM